MNSWYAWGTPRYHDGNVFPTYALSGAGCSGGGGGAFSMQLRNTDASIIGGTTNSWSGTAGTRTWALFSSRWFYVNSRYDYQGGGCNPDSAFFTGTLTY